MQLWRPEFEFDGINSGSCLCDDHYKSEWVNVSSGTGSPGFCRTKSREP